MNTGIFIISLDFELAWGVKDIKYYNSYQKNVVQARTACTEILNLFSQYNIHATWATVGMLYASNKTELENFIPTIKPRYGNEKKSTYFYLKDVGSDEKKDPYHFANSLVQEIKNTTNQELGTHTFSHYFCSEKGADIESFRADLISAINISEKVVNQIPQSIVFPKNEIHEAYIQVLKEMGIKTYRGNARAYPVSASKLKHTIIRIIRFIDTYIPLLGNMCYDISNSKTTPLNVSASRFLRPYCEKLWFLERLKIRRVKNQMKYAAKHGKMFHLWWHPHNFGSKMDECILELEDLLRYYQKLNSQYGFSSMNMIEYYKKCKEYEG